MNNKYICVHGHFYQPPREHAWLEEIEFQDSAYPYHDWNERITVECYAPNGKSRILDRAGKIAAIVSNYSRMSFNFGPTVLSWMEKHDAPAYEAIIEADAQSSKNFNGHGAALAQVYNHMIMPLANFNDKYTQVCWGIQDFEYRFKRKPEGMWLAETALDLETLDIMAECGIKFTLASPYQARRTRALTGAEWQDVSGGRIDPKQPYVCRLPSGRTIVIFFYDGPVSQEIAFARLLDNGENFAQRLTGLFSAAGTNQLVHIATDGESYGHHHKYGDMALAYALQYIESKGLAKITVYGQYLEHNAPVREVEVFENSSWSCVHGVERWRADCGCNSGSAQAGRQLWRRPLREAMDWLRDTALEAYQQKMLEYTPLPWAVRNDYITLVMNRTPARVKTFFQNNFERPLAPDEHIAILKLLEMQRQCMLMYTSCGWFFDEMSGIETMQILQYACRAIQLLAETCGTYAEDTFKKMLESAPSNIPAMEHGGRIYREYIQPTAVDLSRVAAHYAMVSLFEDFGNHTRVYAYDVERKKYEVYTGGRQKTAWGVITVRSVLTGQEQDFSFGVLHMGDHNLVCGVQEYADAQGFAQLAHALSEKARAGDSAAIIKFIEAQTSKKYSLWHVFRDQQRSILHTMIQDTIGQAENELRRIRDVNYPLMRAMNTLRMPLPRVLASTLESVITIDTLRVLDAPDIDFTRLAGLAREARQWNVAMDAVSLSFSASNRLTRLMEQLADNPRAEAMTDIISLLEILKELPVQLRLWKAQNIYFSLSGAVFSGMQTLAATGDIAAQAWTERFVRLGDLLRVALP